MKTRKSIFGFGAIAVTILLLLAGIGLNVHVSLNPHVAWGQASSYQVLTTAFGAGVNGRPSLVPSTQVIDTQTTVAAGTLNGTTSPAYDASVPRDYNRMVNVSFNVTAVPGTSPSLTPTVQESDDGGKNWYAVKAQDGSTFAAITTTGAVTGKDFAIYGDLIRVSYAASGTGNFTFTDSLTQAQ